MTIQYTAPRASLLQQALAFVAPGLLLLAVALGLGLLSLVLGLTVGASALPATSLHDAARSIAVSRDMALFVALGGVGLLVLGLLAFLLASLAQRLIRRGAPAASSAAARVEAIEEREAGKK